MADGSIAAGQTRAPGPRVTVGLPTYNGERYLSESLDALLAQTYRDFELIISDNASTDGTPGICQRYVEKDPRVRYIRQEHNIGAAANHNVLIDQARGEYFKWASDDDLYNVELLERCVALLDENDDVVVAHAADAFIDSDGRIIGETTYRLATRSPSPSERFRSVLYGRGGNDFYGLVRTDVLRRTHRHGSYHNADRTIVAELALHGRFAHWPQVLYFRRDHVDRSERDTGRATDDRPPREGWTWVRSLVKYVSGFVDGIRAAPLTPSQRAACYVHLGVYVLTRLVPVHRLGDVASEDPAIRDRAAQSPVLRCWNAVVGSRNAKARRTARGRGERPRLGPLLPEGAPREPC